MEVMSMGELLAQVERLTCERDQYRRDFVTMSNFAAQLTARLKLQGCTDADIARIAVPPAPTPYLLGSEEYRARTDERITSWIDRHRDDKDASALVARIRELEQRLREISTLSHLNNQPG